MNQLEKDMNLAARGERDGARELPASDAAHHDGSFRRGPVMLEHEALEHGRRERVLVLCRRAALECAWNVGACPRLLGQAE